MATTKLEGCWPRLGFSLKADGMLRLPVIHLSSTHSKSTTRPHWFLPKVNFLFLQDQFQRGMWSHFHHPNILLLAVQFQYQLRLELFCWNFPILGCFCQMFAILGADKRRIPSPSVGCWWIWPFCEFMSWSLGSLADSSSEGAVTGWDPRARWGLALNQTKQSAPAPPKTTLGAKIKLPPPNCSLGHYIVEPFLTSCSPGYANNWCLADGIIMTARAATTQQLDNLRPEPLTQCRKLSMFEVNWCRRRFIGAGLPSVLASKPDCWDTARWQGGKVARWQGGKVARWQGGKVAMVIFAFFCKKPLWWLLALSRTQI